MDSTFFNKFFSFFLLINFFLLLNISYQKEQIETKNNLPIKRMIIVLIPGIPSHNIVIQNLLDYTISHEEEFKYEYHIISHKIDSDIWEQKLKSENKHNSYKLYIYGDSSSYEEKMNSAIEEMNNNPTFGFFGFNNAMSLNIKQFMESGILNKLKRLQDDYRLKNNEDYFHMITTDVPNFIHKLIYVELNIKLNLYILSSSYFQIFYPNFELNSAYTPMIGTIYTNEMTFLERLKNSFIFSINKILFKIFYMYQTQIINSYGYDLDNIIHIYDSFHILQYPLGLSFPISLPPNFALIGSVTSQPAKKINDENIEKILNKYKKNIYISDGALLKYYLGINDMVKIFKDLESENIGVIISYNKKELSDEQIKNLPKNVYVTKVKEQNSILGDNRINLFVTNGDFNSVQESVYHGKPMVVLGFGLGHLNVASFVKSKKLGEVFQNKNLINSDNIFLAIKKVLNSEEYKLNTEKIGNIMKAMKNPREEFQYWINYGFKYGYQHLQIQSYKNKYSWIIINGYDIAFVWIIIFIIIIFIIKKIYNCIHDCLCGKCENKHKIKGRVNHYKFD